ncbi:MAG: HNH endonuclease [Paludibacteraceae bacterium]|nr:HNH endonuclease [Paludibacteraceae bacterium]
MCANVSPCPLQGKGRKRGFEIIRTPELKGSSFLFNNVRVRYVGTCPETGISFYCNNGEGSVLGVCVYPDGRKVNAYANETTYANSKNAYDAKRKWRYLHFQSAFGRLKQILASHAVWMAAGRTIPAGMTIDHIDGCTTNNYIGNLRCVSNAINIRDGGFLRRLRNKGFNTSRIDRAILLRYFDRMAYIKASITKYRYRHLTRDQLHHILYDPDFSIPV